MVWILPRGWFESISLSLRNGLQEETNQVSSPEIYGVQPSSETSTAITSPKGSASQRNNSILHLSRHSWRKKKQITSVPRPDAVYTESGQSWAGSLLTSHCELQGNHRSILHIWVEDTPSRYWGRDAGEHGPGVLHKQVNRWWRAACLAEVLVPKREPFQEESGLQHRNKHLLDEPGPNQYNTERAYTFVLHRSPSIIISPEALIPRWIRKDETPGPGTYNVEKGYNARLPNTPSFYIQGVRRPKQHKTGPFATL